MQRNEALPVSPSAWLSFVCSGVNLLHAIPPQSLNSTWAWGQPVWALILDRRRTLSAEVPITTDRSRGRSKIAWTCDDACVSC